ncbi:IS3 family transposase [Mediterraneibacter faecis]|uniref:IS3 family transposase n=1 Tax=Mediterraneibacter faecis TaxID=592978 RepID=UPI003B504BAB
MPFHAIFNTLTERIRTTRWTGGPDCFKIRDYGHAYRLVFEYLEAFYNTKRIHSHCDYMSPNDYEDLYRRVQQHKLLMVG